MLGSRQEHIATLKGLPNTFADLGSVREPRSIGFPQAGASAPGGNAPWLEFAYAFGMLSATNLDRQVSYAVESLSGRPYLFPSLD